MVKVALCSAVLMAFGCHFALAQVPSESGANLQTCHTEDYIRCALVIAGCTASCGSDYNCLVDCVINKHHQDCVDCIRSHQMPEPEREIKVQDPTIPCGPYLRCSLYKGCCWAKKADDFGYDYWCRTDTRDCTPMI